MEIQRILKITTHFISLYWKNNLFYNKGVVFILLLSVGLFSCEKSIIRERSILLPSDSLSVKVIDTITGCIDNRIETNLSAVNFSFSPLGTISEPNFGTVMAGVYTQIGFMGSDLNFGINPIVDSVVLTLAVDQTYGPHTQDLVIQVDQLAEPIDTTSRALTTDTYLLSRQIGQQSISIGEIENADSGIIRMALDKAFGQDVLLRSGTSVLSNTPNFQKFIHGLFIQTVNTTGDGLADVNFRSVQSKIRLYYHNTSNGKLFQDFFFQITNQNILRLNHFTHELTGSAVETFVDNHTDNDSLIFVQGLSGVLGRVKLPYLSAMKNIAINKAILRLSVVDSTQGYPTPSSLFLLYENAEGQKVILPDFENRLARASFGGNRKEENGRILYEFNIPLFIQGLIDGVYPNDQLFVVPVARGARDGRVILGGFAHSTEPVRLNLTTTQIN